MPRPRKVSDEEVFAATHRAMTQWGPGELTLQHVAAEAGVTAGALVQRFGGKRQLLLALAASASAATEGYIEALPSGRGPLASLRAYARGMAGLAASPAALARNLAYLQIDLADSEFRAHLATQARATRTGLQRLVTEAIAQGELIDTADPALLGKLVETVLSGSLMTWAFYQEGKAADWLEQDLDFALAPWLGPNAAKARAPARRKQARR
jgi:AcrR family transcriptional regulator